MMRLMPEAGDDVIFLFLRHLRIVLRATFHDWNPQEDPNDADGAENVENAFPAESQSEHARQCHWDDSSDVASGNREPSHSRSLHRWCPLRPNVVHARESYSLEDSFNDSHGEEKINAVVGSERCQQCENCSYADAKREDFVPTVTESEIAADELRANVAVEEWTQHQSFLLRVPVEILLVSHAAVLMLDGSILRHRDNRHTEIDAQCVNIEESEKRQQHNQVALFSPERQGLAVNCLMNSAISFRLAENSFNVCFY